MSDEAESPIVLKAGSRGKVVTFLQTHVGKSGEQLDGVTIRLWRTGLDEGRQQVAMWTADHAAKAPGDWADQVVELVRHRTEVAGTKSEFSLEAARDSDGEVIRSYPMTAQPATANLSPTPEGLVHLSMRHSAAMVQTVIQDRAAATASYQQVIDMQRSEIDRLVLVIRAHEAREDKYRERELALLDRERALLTREATSEADSRERNDDRLDRVVDKIGDALESGAVAMARGAAERMEPTEATKLLRELAPLVAKIVGE